MTHSPIDQCRTGRELLQAAALLSLPLSLDLFSTVTSRIYIIISELVLRVDGILAAAVCNNAKCIVTAVCIRTAMSLYLQRVCRSVQEQTLLSATAS